MPHTKVRAMSETTTVPVSADWETLLQEQREMEEEAFGKGAERFHRRLQQAAEGGELSTVGAYRVLAKRLLLPMEEALSLWVEESKGKRGGRHVALRWVEMLGTRTVAYLTVRTVLDTVQIHNKSPLDRVCRALCRLMKREAIANRFETLAPGLYSYRMSQFQTRSAVHIARSLSATMGHARCQECREKGEGEGGCKHLDTSDLNISPLQVQAIGYKLLDILLESTVDRQGRPSFTREVVATVRSNKKKTTNYLSVAPHVARWIDKQHARMELFSPVQRPLVVPPLRWAQGVRGGYLFHLRGHNPLIRGASEEHLASVEAMDLPVVYSALNRIQETPWRINRRVVELLEEIERRRGGMAGVPLLDPEPEPNRILMEWTSDEERRADPSWQEWNKEAHRVKNENAARVPLANEFFRVYNVARKLVDKDAIWFAYSVDFRGRVYPISDSLSPQGNDLHKGLLMFSEGKSMGTEGGDYLAIHGANALDVCPWGATGPGTKISKWTLGERVRWIKENTERICQVAEDPFSDRWWMEADEPLQFYAFCCEWKAWGDSGWSPDHCCALPVSQDGSCNGLQHFSAMFRDEVGGAAVNLVPQARPQDIYARVAEVVEGQVKRDAPVELVAHLWETSGLLGRKLCKQPTMTVSYGATRFGFTDQLLNFVNRKAGWTQAEIKQHFTALVDGREKNLVGKACSYMGKTVWDAVGSIVRSARDAMDWMQRWARLVAKTGQPLRWIVPMTGFPVVQGYYEMGEKRVKTKLAGSFVWPSVKLPTEEVKVTKQVSSVAPNVVHSLDAAALMLTVNQAAAEGVECFAMVHDSYGTCPGDAPLLARCTRQSFVRLYSQDIAGDLEAQWRQQWEDSMDPASDDEEPVRPERGQLDLGGVYASQYFFA